jgi:glycosyltransferase involved in cell wall biosynthesis
MKVLYILPVGERGGAERMVEMWAAAHTPRVTPIVVMPDGPLLQSFEALGVKAYAPPDFRMSNLRRSILFLRDLIHRESVDLIHSSMPKGHLFGALAAAASGRKEIWFSHGPISGNWYQGLLPLLPSCALLVNSRYMFDLQSRTLYNAKRICLQPLGIDVAALAPSADVRADRRREHHVRDDAFVIGFFGRIARWKGQHVLLEALGMLRGVDGFESIQCMLIGGNQFGLDEEYRRELIDMIDRLGLQSCVSMTGHIDDVYGHFDMADLVVHASTVPEPFGLVVAEGMAKGKVVIATCEGGPGEMIRHDQTGLVYRAGDSAALAEQIVRVLRMSAAERQNMGLAARRSITDTHSLTVSVACLESFYEQVLAE